MDRTSLIGSWRVCSSTIELFVRQRNDHTLQVSVDQRRIVPTHMHISPGTVRYFHGTLINSKSLGARTRIAIAMSRAPPARGSTAPDVSGIPAYPRKWS